MQIQIQSVRYKYKVQGRHAAWSSGLDKRKMEEMHLVELSPESKLDNRKVGRHALGLVISLPYKGKYEYKYRYK